MVENVPDNVPKSLQGGRKKQERKHPRDMRDVLLGVCGVYKKATVGCRKFYFRSRNRTGSSRS